MVSFGTMRIAPRDTALTFARTRDRRLVLVSSYAGGRVNGIELDGDDPITAYGTHGYDALASMDGREVTVPLAELGLPVELAASHIAVGTNFPAHAEEATVEDGPFLFPKEVEPTPFDAPVAMGDALLDYEVELCFVALEDFDVTAPPERTGLILCNDVTDRAKLMRHIDPRDVTSGKGFTTGKSAPGYMPVGNLFVIPRHMRAFAGAVELRLWRDARLVQSARQSLAIWDFDEMLRQSAARADVTWDYEGRQVSLPVRDGKVPARTGVLGGTPDGTVFKGIDRAAMLRGALDWLAGGWSKPVPHWVVERQIALSQRARSYLQPGERMRIHVEGMGELDNPVIGTGLV